MKKLMSLALCMVLMFSVFFCSAAADAAVADTAETGYANLGTAFFATIQLSKYPGNYLTHDNADGFVHLAIRAANTNLQKWYFIRQSDNSYVIKNCYTNRYLTAFENAVYTGNQLNGTPYTGYITQKWYLSDTSNGIQILSKADPNYDIECTSVTELNNIELYKNSYFSGSYFTISKISSVTSLPAPSFKLTNVKEGVQIKWSEVAGAMTYLIYRYNDSKKSWAPMKETYGTSFVDTNVASGYSYKYTVKIVSPVVSSWTAKSIRFIGAPVVSVDISGSGPRVKWAAVHGAAKYRVFVKNGSSWKKLGDTTGTSYTHTGCQYNTYYTYTVRCINADGTAYTSGYNTVGVQARILATPKVTLTLKPDHIEIKWNSIPGASGYRLYYKTGSSSWKQFATTTSTSYLRYNLSNGTGYYFTVRAMDNNGTILSGFKSSSCMKFYHAPEVEEIRYTNTYRTLYWDPVSGAKKYRVFSWNGKKWVTRGTTQATSFKVDITGEDYQNVCYAVRCMDANDKYISSFYECVLEGSCVYNYMPKEYTSTHTVN